MKIKTKKSIHPVWTIITLLIIWVLTVAYEFPGFSGITYSLLQKIINAAALISLAVTFGPAVNWKFNKREGNIFAFLMLLFVITFLHLGFSQASEKWLISIISGSFQLCLALFLVFRTYAKP